jgi:type IV pilus biogenesis protein CpaD/CtpE
LQKSKEKRIMATKVLQKKRKNIDLPEATLQKLSIMAASQGKSLKVFIENILVSKADTLQIEITNPSPSGDPFFSNPSNLAEIEKRVKAHREGRTKPTIVLRSADDITNFINSL